MRTSLLRILSAVLLTFGLTGVTHAQFKVAQLGGNQIGSVTANGGGSYTIVGGGNDIWDQADEFTYAYQEITGDFDVQVRVESFTPNARWSKAGIMARETLSEYSRMAIARVAPPDVPTSNGGNGANDVAMGYRTGIQGSGLSGGNHEDRDGANPLPNPNFPNAWLRLSRIGNVINSSNSLDGVTWNFVASQDTATWNGGAFPATILVGLGASRHSGGPTATAQDCSIEAHRGIATWRRVVAAAAADADRDEPKTHQQVRTKRADVHRDSAQGWGTVVSREKCSTSFRRHCEPSPHSRP